MVSDRATPLAALGDERAVLGAMLGEPVAELERVGRGRNSRVYRVRTGDADYAAKFYFQKTADGRDRLQVEYEALGFLWGAGVRRIAQPVAEDRKRQVAVYAFINGESVVPPAVGDTELDQLVSFAAELKNLSSRGVPSGIFPAAEAFFTANDVIRNVEARLWRLRELDAAARGYEALREFLHDRFEPAFATLRQRAQSLSDPDRELSAGHRTLSPSDYGFHNTLRRADGSLVFLDFEYFGWDDPAKLLSDLLLHPMMPLARGQRARLAQGLDAVFGADANWRGRVEALYPLFGLKWCMIMLNEFLPSHIARNRFTERDSAEIEAVQAQQLGAAAAMLGRIMEEMDRFPFWSAATA